MNLKDIGSVSQSGFPARRSVRRGGRGRGKGAHVGVPTEHMTNLQSAMSKGDHAGARSHAFALIRSLPKGQQGVPTPNDLADASGPADAASSGEDDMDGMNDTGLPSKLPSANTPVKGGSTGNMRLAQMLKAKGMAKPPKAGAY